MTQAIAINIQQAAEPAVNQAAQISLSAKILRTAAKAAVAGLATLAYLGVTVGLTVATIFFSYTFSLPAETQAFVLGSITAAGTRVLGAQGNVYSNIYQMLNQVSWLKTE